MGVLEILRWGNKAAPYKIYLNITLYLQNSYNLNIQHKPNIDFSHPSLYSHPQGCTSIPFISRYLSQWFCGMTLGCAFWCLETHFNQWPQCGQEGFSKPSHVFSTEHWGCRDELDPGSILRQLTGCWKRQTLYQVIKVQQSQAGAAASSTCRTHTPHQTFFTLSRIPT